MRVNKPNYTQLPNSVLDNMSEFSDAELRVVLLACRQTFGWQRERAKLSVSFFAKGTGMSGQGVSNAIKSLLEKNLIERFTDGDSFAYQVTVSDDDFEQPAPLNAVAPSPKRRFGDPLNAVAPSPLNAVGVNKERGLKKEKETEATAFEATETGQPQKQRSQKRELTDLWCAEFKKKHGWAYKFDGAKDGRAADRLLALGMDPVDLITIAKSAWNHPDWFNCKQAATLAGFECRYNDIRHELTNPPGAKPVYQKPRVDIRQFKSGNF